MKIPEMAWITQINYTLSKLSVYSIYFIIQNIYIFCLLSYSNSNVFIHIPWDTSVTDMWIFYAWAPSGVQYEWKIHHPPVSQTRLEPSPWLKCNSELF